VVYSVCSKIELFNYPYIHIILIILLKSPAKLSYPVEVGRLATGDI
jgi:hypothetical protein